MAEDFTPSFEHQTLESDIARLSAEIEKHKENPETRGLQGQELLKKSIQTYTQAAPAPAKEGSSPSPLPAYAQSATAETKLEIERLLDLAFHRGILAAASEAKRSSAFVLDAFHDALTDRLYTEFQKRGLLK